ncbi:hypothetical protein GCG54_00007266 [Colletotrichum gloeosporioides]|uniref:Uncharacterized protein n=1 Tax=Colletotrichum gloeosporioides TaxID=474922 RepID=A0A8H4CNQ8_COLGL|nr:uncharacterized protein GCG54_00007266 [Colletotrichum gloeosporioides]KAF3807012.1 hypothetical protein GCG54_00007266 [Colletotrichum gloeosporioides]
MEDQGLHHQEVRVPGEAQSQIQDTQTIDHVAYQNNMEDRRRLFQDIQEVDYLKGTNPDRYEKMSKDSFTKEVWALYWVAPYDEVIRARERIRRGEIKSWNMDTFLQNATEMLPMVMYLVKNEAYYRGCAQERTELVNKHFGYISSLHLLFGGKKAWEYSEAPASAGLRGPPPDPILTDLRRRATAMIFLLEAAQAGHVTDDILEEEAVRAVTSSQEPDVIETHFRELRRIHESQWQQKKREKRAARNNSISYLDNIQARQDILKQIQEANYPVTMPIGNNTIFARIGRDLLSKEAWSAFWVAPIDQLRQLSLKISNKQIQLREIQNALAETARDLPDAIAIIMKNKYGYETNTPMATTEMGTDDNEEAHIYPQKKIEHASECVAKIQCLDLLFGEQKIKEYTTALCSDCVKNLANLTTLDEGLRTMWDQGKVTLRVRSFNENRVNLAVHYLRDSKLRIRSRAQERYRWENDFTVTPADVLDFTDAHVIPTATQYYFQDEFTFKMHAEDRRLRSDPVLLDLRDKIAVMAPLLGATEYIDDDHGNVSEGTRQSPVDEAEDDQSVDGDISDMGEDLYMDDDNYEYDSDE